ncbi:MULTISPECIES: hypothetical protein [unclassified Streptomyces]|uniref:hypothetical protein n=1 Tax=unclassified Streptomyces TaxID=2593676 RepID=UPI0033E6B06E
MRRHSTTALVLTALASLAFTGCSDDSSGSSEGSPAAASSPPDASRTAGPTPLPSAALDALLLSEQDLGEGYVRKAERAQQDVTVIGCPALERLGGNVASGGSLHLPRRAKTAFTYGAGGTSEMSEELYSDTPSKLSDGIGRIYDAMASCPTYQVVSGTTAIDMTTQATTAPKLGEEQWSQLLTYSVGGQRSVIKQTAIRSGTVVVIVAGSPALVDAHLGKALAKIQAR